MDNDKLIPQIRRNSLALLSLVVALSALSYNTWRNESTEKNRNIRAAEFDMLKGLGEVQQIIDYAHLRQDHQRGDLTQGLGRILFIRDLATLTPKPVEDAAEKLRAAWVMHGDKLVTSQDALGVLSEEVLNTRRTVLSSLQSLK